ncbi:hypothetical protein MRB53_018678 [Persea americana]|uniref:Uncharacterized protein n=1 Tax=Persea americana TaxID=3435 RepID=A0ACC2M9I9_PERAE|nr:hypothetical protein MRB53_018678 [Persea americana]
MIKNLSYSVQFTTNLLHVGHGERATESTREPKISFEESRSKAWKDAGEEARQNGIGTIVEAGGSKRGSDAIACCNKYGVGCLLCSPK